MASITDAQIDEAIPNVPAVEPVPYGQPRRDRTNELFKKLRDKGNAPLVRTVAFKTIGDIDSAGPEDLMFLGKALKDIAGADKLIVDREINVRKLVAAKAEQVAASVASTARKAGMTDDTVEMIRTQILGIPAAGKKGAAA